MDSEKEPSNLVQADRFFAGERACHAPLYREERETWPAYSAKHYPSRWILTVYRSLLATFSGHRPIFPAHRSREEFTVSSYTGSATVEARTHPPSHHAILSFSQHRFACLRNIRLLDCDDRHPG